MMLTDNGLHLPTKDTLKQLGIYAENDLVAESNYLPSVGIAASCFNFEITSNLVKAVLEELENNSISRNLIKVIWVPGAFELPVGIKWLSEENKFEVLMAIGCLIKGETDHYHYIASEVTRKIMDLSVNLRAPVIYGVLTCRDLNQARERSEGKTNKGYEFAKSAIWMARVKKEFLNA